MRPRRRKEAIRANIFGKPLKTLLDRASTRKWNLRLFYWNGRRGKQTRSGTGIRWMLRQGATGMAWPKVINTVAAFDVSVAPTKEMRRNRIALQACYVGVRNPKRLAQKAPEPE